MCRYREVAARGKRIDDLPVVSTPCRQSGSYIKSSHVRGTHCQIFPLRDFAVAGVCCVLCLDQATRLLVLSLTSLR